MQEHFRGWRLLVMNRKHWKLALVGVPAFAALVAGSSLLGTPGGTIIDPGAEAGIVPAFLFEPEVSFESLKNVAIWNELEQMLDHPYAQTACPDEMGQPVKGNDQGWPARCTAIHRRRSFLPAGCTYDPSTGLPPCDDSRLAQFQIHPLNYNPTTGEQFRILDPSFPGVDHLMAPVGPAGPDRDLGAISPGSDRMGPGSEPAIDYNSPLVADQRICITLGTEQLCEADAGEPDGYAGAAVCGDDNNSTDVRAHWTETRPQCEGHTGELYDPSLLPNGEPRGIVTHLNKPTVGQDYTVNSVAALAGHAEDLAPSNPSDYYQNRQMATVLGKALFWDMQLGSDGVQSCGTCHFTAGIDTRTRDQVNPNHLGGDSTLQIYANRHLGTPATAADQVANRDIVASDFPTHKLIDVNQVGEPLLNPGNVRSDTNDVVSSMGVRFRTFANIPVPGSGAFSLPNNGVRALLPDIGTATPDPIPIFQGIRRVEPRNTPTMFNAAFNFDNFWDGRARHDFNGGSVFGASDPQSHVYVDEGGSLTPTRQIIRFGSIASIFTGPALSEFEMSFIGRNWQKIGKKLLQGDGVAGHANNVTPLAAQLVSTSDSVMGPYSNQGGSWCRSQSPVRATATGKPGLCLSYQEIIRMAYYPKLWQNTTQHLNGTASVCNSGASNGAVTPVGCDPFDGFTLAIAANRAAATDRAQFTQMEANFTLFGGLGLQAWIESLVSDDTPLDRFLDANPEAFKTLGEPGEPGLVDEIPLCTENGGVQPCLTEVGKFVRNPAPGEPDPLLGMDLFFASNMSNRNKDFLTARCGNCHAGGTLTDNTMEISGQLTVMDFIPEFVPGQPGTELALEPLGRSRQISGFLLESEINGNAQDGIERNMINQSIFVNPTDGLSYPSGAAFFDNGVYNIGVRPIADDSLRGGTDPWGWPLSLASLALKNLGGVNMLPGTAIPTFDPDAGISGGLFEETAQDAKINPGFEASPAHPMLPPHLAPWVNEINVGNAHPEFDELSGGLNTLMEVPIIEGFLDVLGPFNPAAIRNEGTNVSEQALMGTWPNVNRVGFMGSVKAPQLRNIELTGPYFHNGSRLTLRQIVDFYSRGGDFPITNQEHRDFMIMNLNTDVQSQLKESDKVALVDFLLQLTDERVAHEQAPFDRPEIFVPVDGRAPDNLLGRTQLLGQSLLPIGCGATPCFRRLLPVGAAGHANRLPAFLNVSSTRIAGPNNDQYDR
jgi:cytochrome c peroxidase